MKKAHNAVIMFGAGSGMTWRSFLNFLGIKQDTVTLKMRMKMREDWIYKIKSRKKGERLKGLSLKNPDSKLGFERHHPETKRLSALWYLYLINHKIHIFF